MKEIRGPETSWRLCKELSLMMRPRTIAVAMGMEGDEPRRESGPQTLESSKGKSVSVTLKDSYVPGQRGHCPKL